MKLLDGKRWRSNKSLHLLRRASYLSLYRFKQTIACIESILNKFLNNKQKNIENLRNKLQFLIFKYLIIDN
jgi:hypothetical protein